MDPQRKFWNDQHRLLHHVLTVERDPEKIVRVFLIAHGMVHSAKLNQQAQGSFQDEVLQDLTDAQMRIVLPGTEHSIGWILWHITRVEDVTTNLLLADSRQVLRRAKWQSKLGVGAVDTGNGWSRAGVVALSDSINLDALVAYRRAVGKNTEQIVARIAAQDWSKQPEAERVKRLTDEDAVTPNAYGLVEYWGGHPKSNLLLMPTTRHPFFHLNEARQLRAKLMREIQ